jgi:Na+-transporting methylmalonyl-CoA/oxaloacetate decarboxylase gamma subunit
MKIKGFLVILVLVAIVAFFIYFIGTGEKKLIESQVGSYSKTKETVTRTNMNTLKRAVDIFAAQNGRLPERLKDLRLNISLSTGKMDAWGTEIKYERLSELEFRLISAGSDRIFNTDDDIIIE